MSLCDENIKFYRDENISSHCSTLFSNISSYRISRTVTQYRDNEMCWQTWIVMYCDSKFLCQLKLLQYYITFPQIISSEVFFLQNLLSSKIFFLQKSSFAETVHKFHKIADIRKQHKNCSYTLHQHLIRIGSFLTLHIWTLNWCRRLYVKQEFLLDW